MACSQVVWLLREMLQGDQRLLKAPYRFPVGRTRRRFGTGLTTVTQGLLPHLTPEGMVRQPFDLFGQAVGREPFDGFDDPGVEGAPSLTQETAVGHLVREGVLKRVFELGKEARLIEELSRLQVGERPGAGSPRRVRRWPAAARRGRHCQ